MIQIELIDLIVILLFCAAFPVFRILPAKIDDFKRIAACAKLVRGLKRAVEDGRRIHFSLGRGSLFFNGGAAGMSALMAAKSAMRAGTSGDCTPAVTCADGATALLSAGMMSDAFPAQQNGSSSPSWNFPLAGVTPATYALGCLESINHPDTCANVLLGETGAESAFIAEAADRREALALTGSGDLSGQAALSVWTDDVLYGDLLYVAPGILQSATGDCGDVGGDIDTSLPRLNGASLRAQDFLRWALILAVLAGALYRGIVR